MGKKAFTVFILLLFVIFLQAQRCTTPGQTPSSAILVCSTEPVLESFVPICGGDMPIPVSCTAGGGPYVNSNPFWFKLACYAPGTLGFVIDPLDITDNYNWALFDITGRNPDNVFTVPSTFVASNWSDDPGETGATNSGTDAVVCSGAGQSLYSSMPNLQQGHEYLLLVSHPNSANGGFQLSIGGGSALIADPLEPKLLSVRPSCDGTQVIVKMTRGMKCNSLAADGTDFAISGGVTIVGALSTGCDKGTTDSIILTLANPIPSGNYTLSIQYGSDGNTLLDNCLRSVPVGDNLPLIVSALQSTPMDSLTTVACAPSVLQLVFSRPIRCSSIATDGTDFTVTGPLPVAVTGFVGGCSPTAATTIIKLKLSAPIYSAGVYQVHLVNGSDGNTLIDECGRVTLPGSLSFNVKDTVSADFNYTIKISCKNDTLSFNHDGKNGITDWNWVFDNKPPVNAQNTIQVYAASGNHTIQLIVTNGFCTDTASVKIALNNKIAAAFDAPKITCPDDLISFANKSSGVIDTWQWDFGDGNTSILQSPPIKQYPDNTTEKIYHVQLIASSNAMGCSDTANLSIDVLSNCYINVPTAFTPNGDGLNDYLYPLNAIKADNLEFRVYNRVGELVFISRDWTKKWDGRIRGVLQDTGVFAWTLRYTHHDTGEKVLMKGTTVLMR